MIRISKIVQSKASIRIYKLIIDFAVLETHFTQILMIGDIHMYIGGVLRIHFDKTRFDGK